MNTQLIKLGTISSFLIAASMGGNAMAHHGQNTNNSGNNHNSVRPAHNNNNFFGNWQNVERNTRGITQLKIKSRLNRNKIVVKAWGQCQPNDCAWGKTKGTIFKNQQSRYSHNGKKKLIAQFTTSFKESTLIMTKMGPNRMRVQNFTRFTDNSGRQPYFSNVVMKRGPVAVAPVPQRQDIAVTKVNHWWNANRGRYIVEATVKNMGNKAAGVTTVELERTRSGRPVHFTSGKKSIQQLLPGQQRVIRLKLPFRPTTSGRLQVHAKGSNGQDKNVTNNKRKVTF